MRTSIQTSVGRMEWAVRNGRTTGLARRIGRWPRMRQTLILFAGAAAIAILMSTEILFQPFVWRNWGVGEIIASWLEIARDRLVVALTIAAMLAGLGLGQDRGAGAGWRISRTVLAVLLGSSLGELTLLALGIQDDRTDFVSVFGRILRWGVVGGAIAVMLQLWRSRADLAAQAEEARIEEARTRRLTALTQTEMLQRQIEPHFLFNTLGTIRLLRSSDPEHGQHLLARLLDYMSAALSCTSGQQTTLGEEIKLVLAYLDLCAFRMQGRLIIRCDASADLSGCMVPPLILATLAENAIKHGIFPHQGGEIEITARLAAGMLEMAVTDDGVGLTGEMGHGAGLANITERLHLLYGTAAQFRLSAHLPRGVRAIVRFPARWQDPPVRH